MGIAQTDWGCAGAGAGGQLSGHERAAHTPYRGAELPQRMIGHVEVHIRKYKFNEQPCELLSPEGGSEDKGASCR